ncbi:MAG: hypothetical protein KDC80_24785 [Saprospiraceae bacterium]|nr:hypothetical protein [Saprospiraceae bacterium]
MGIIQLQRQYDHERIEKGCQLAFLHPITSYRRLLGILEKRLDEHAQLFESQNENVSHIPEHANTRGANYFSNN